uniref:SEA domain-containing protein n=1 Tax=Lepisosteus oculatus TaxID=7918 RepID=W5N0S9_LEPOC
SKFILKVQYIINTTSTNSTDQTSTLTENPPVTTMTTKEGNDSSVSTLGTMSTTWTTPPVAHTTTGVETTTNSTGMLATTQAPESPTTSIHNTTAATENSTITDSFSPTTATSLSTASTTEVDNSSSTTTSRYSSTTMTPTGTSLTSNTSTVQSSPSSPAGFTPGKCSPDLCPFGSTCVDLFKNYTCQCLPGLYYDSLGNCVDAKVFPGTLHLVNINYKTSMSDKSSKDFKETAFSISTELRGILKNTKGYLNSLVLELKQGSVVASIQNIYEPSSDATVSSVKEDITKAIQNSSRDLCQGSQSPCDTTSTICSYLASGIAKCTCIPGFLESPYSNRSCMACLSGYKQDGAQCVKCPFGYAGFNCSDSSLLAVVVISCVLGGLLLIVVLAFIIYCCRKSKGSTYGSPYPAEDFLVWPKQEVPRIPRASTSWDPAPMEMTENGSTRVLVNK